MRTLNLNRLARQISALEGGRVNLSIAQIKEVLRCALCIMAAELRRGMNPVELSRACFRTWKTWRRRLKAA